MLQLRPPNEFGGRSISEPQQAAGRQREGADVIEYAWSFTNVKAIQAPDRVNLRGKTARGAWVKPLNSPYIPDTKVTAMFVSHNMPEEMMSLLEG